LIAVSYVPLNLNIESIESRTAFVPVNNRAELADLSGQWIDRALPRNVILIAIVRKGFFNMSGLISEIQRSCLDDATTVESLLRRVKLAASKLKLGSLENWVNSELNGYSGELPGHRILHGQPAGWNPYNGWIPIQTADAFTADLLSPHLFMPANVGLT
jgi:hypothetical protein